MISHNFCHCLSYLQCFLQSSLQCGIAISRILNTDTNTSIGTGISISIRLNHHPGICMNFQSGMGINMALSVEHYILQKLAKIRLKSR